MAIVLSTDGSLSAEMKTYYDRRLIARTMPELLFAKFGQRVLSHVMVARSSSSVSSQRLALRRRLSLKVCRLLCN